MKLLIVDDEYHVIKTVKYLTRMSGIDIDEIFEAVSAKDAITIIEREHPEILITDIVMTDVTGLDLMNYLNNTSIHIKIIVISGYNNFEYIRATLRGGGVDYLLKPIDADQLTSAIQKAMDEWKREDAQKKQTQNHLEMINSMSAICKETLLLRIFTQDSPEKSYQDLIRIVPSLKHCRNCIIGYYNCRPFITVQSEETYELLLHSIAYIDTKLRNQNIGSCFFGSDDKYEVFLLLQNHTSESLRILEDQLKQTAQNLPIPFAFGLSRPMAFPALAKEAFSQAKTAFFEQDIFSVVPAILSYSHVRQEQLQTQQPELEQQMFSALITGNEALFDEAIQQWTLSMFPVPDIPLSHALSVIERFNLLTDSWKNELMKQYSNLNISFHQALEYHQFIKTDGLFSIGIFIKTVKITMFQLSGELTSPSSNPQNDIIHQVAHYIRLNYNKPFSQFACAQLFFINKNYMCRKFKNTFHISMVSYLNQIRIDRAKELLANPGIKIKDVANLVGYEDEKYFSRQFHKNTGISPNEYRNQLNETT